MMSSIFVLSATLLLLIFPFGAAEHNQIVVVLVKATRTKRNKMDNKRREAENFAVVVDVFERFNI